MKVRVKKEFELHSNHTAHEDDILNLISIDYQIDGDNLFIILEKFNHIFVVYFKDEFDANEHLEFNYEEVRSVDYTWYREDEVNKRIAEVCKKKDEQVEYWKSKFMKLVDKM